MCDYSLMHLASRPAVVGEKLTLQDFGSGTRGFAGTEGDGVVCVLPGTELAFTSLVVNRLAQWGDVAFDDVAVFAQINKESPYAHHDALRFPDGRELLLTCLKEGQVATVLQLPAAPKTEQEAQDQTRLAVVG